MLFPRLRLVLPLVLASCAIPISAVAQQTIGELYATDASVKGSVILAGSGTSILSGSSIQAGAQAATLKLDRGGSVEVCEGTKLSINSSRNGRELLLSLNTGNLELNYPLGTEADTLLTPDLRLMLPGPGTVHVAVRVNPNGDTCVQSLPSNASALVVSETMGDATYQVKPDEVVVFKGGHLTDASRSKQNCGCPPPPTVQVAKAAPPSTPAVPAPPAAPVPTLPAQAPLATLPLPTPTLAGSTPQPTQTVAAAAPPPLAPSPEQHLTLEAPFVFHGNDPAPDLSGNVAVLRLENNRIVQLEPTVVPPANGKKKPAASNEQVAQKQSRGLFSKIGAFFAWIVH